MITDGNTVAAQLNYLVSSLPRVEEDRADALPHIIIAHNYGPPTWEEVNAHDCVLDCAQCMCNKGFYVCHEKNRTMKGELPGEEMGSPDPMCLWASIVAITERELPRGT